MTPSGFITTLYDFCVTNCYDGWNPEAALAQDTDGVFYGLNAGQGADHGCSGGCGTIYRLSTGLGSFVEAVPNFGKTGRMINILGNNLSSAANVTFNGVSATFSVVSSTLLRATVPDGASTGTIQVTTSGGELSSNRPFQVE